MALAPIAQISTTYEQYPNYWMKGYAQGTTTPISMATDSGGGTLLAKAEVSAGGTVPIGFIKTAGDDIFIPYYSEAYDLYLFPTADEADANDTSNAIQVADDMGYLTNLVNQVGEIVVSNMVANTALLVGDIVKTDGYNAVGDSGDASYEVVAAGTGTADGGSFIDLPNTTPATQAKNLFPSGIVNVAHFGAVLDNSTTNNTAIASAIAYTISISGDLYWPAGIAVVSTNIPNFHDISHSGPGAIRRGTDTWYVEGVTNGARSIYVQSNTGADSNDGLASDHPLETEQYALDSIQAINNKSGETGALQLVTGHTVQTGIVIESGDYSWISISSDDATVTASYTGYYITASQCSAPKWNITLDGNNVLERGYSLTTSQGWVENGKGANNCTGRPLYGNSSIIRAGNTIWNGNGDAIYATAGSGFQLGSVTVNDSNGPIGAIICSRASSIEAQGASVNNSAATAFYAKRAGSSINAHSATSDGCHQLVDANRGAIISLNDMVATDVGEGSADDIATCTRARLDLEGASITCNATHTGDGATVTAAGDLNMSSATLTGAGRYGVEIRDGSSFGGAGVSIINSGNHGVFSNQGSTSVSLDGATVTGSGGDDLYCVTGSQIAANGCTTTNGVGTPAIADTNFAAFNVIESNKGIIWD